MNRGLAHLLGWASLSIGAALIAAIMLTPPWLDLQYTHWERGFIEACAKSQTEQVEAYEQFASALSSNDPVLLQRLAYHHLRLKPSDTEFVSLSKSPDEAHIGLDPASPSLAPSGKATTLIEDWLHRSYPVVGIDYPPYEAPDSMFIRLATGPRRLVLLALGGVFLVCGLILPGPVRAGEQIAKDEVDQLPVWRRFHPMPAPAKPITAPAASAPAFADVQPATEVSDKSSATASNEGGDDDFVPAELDDGADDAPEDEHPATA